MDGLSSTWKIPFILSHFSKWYPPSFFSLLLILPTHVIIDLSLIDQKKMVSPLRTSNSTTPKDYHAQGSRSHLPARNWIYLCARSRYWGPVHTAGRKTKNTHIHSREGLLQFCSLRARAVAIASFSSWLCGCRSSAVVKPVHWSRGSCFRRRLLQRVGACVGGLFIYLL